MGIGLLALALCVPFAARAEPTSSAPPTPPTVDAVRTGTVATRDGLLLTLSADTGGVRIFSDASGEVRYSIHVEAAAGSKEAATRLTKKFSLQTRKTSAGITITGRTPKTGELERVRVSYEIHLPQRYNLAISTQAGDIVTQDIDGQVALTTGGGNIQAGRIAGKQGTLAARLESGGGHILVGDVSGGLRASTAGGHITAGDVSGDAWLHTDGGHIQVGKIGGNAQFTTGGGNIAVASADSGATAETTGGRIEFGEAAGAIHARTGGGGVRIARMAGPTELDTSDGGIFLAGVAAPLHAATATGAITAWFSPKFGDASSAPGARQISELTSGQGDIIVYLPRDVAVTIDAQIARGADHHILADPSLPLKVRYQDSSQGRALLARAALNGGGELLHLRTGSGDIQLRYRDARAERQLNAQQAALTAQGLLQQRALLAQMEQQTAVAIAERAPEAAIAAGTAQNAPAPEAAQDEPSGFEVFARRIEGFWWGGVRVDPDEQQKRLQHAVRPAYPEAARLAGLEGDVTLRLDIEANGFVKDVRVLSGDPELARAAVEAVAQWRYAPALLAGKPVNVITTVTLAFRLR